MKIVIFGATGRTGIPLVQKALDTGHQVVAFVRNPAKLSIKHESLMLVQGDVMKAPDVDRALTPDVNAVISVLSPTKGSAQDILPVAVDNILNAMHGQRVKRLIYMTGAGVAMPEDKPMLINHIIKFALKALAGQVLKQSELAVRKVQHSGLDWTILRVPVLDNNPPSGQYRVGWVGVDTGWHLSRADAAEFIIKQLADSRYVCQAPVVSN